MIPAVVPGSEPTPSWKKVQYELRPAKQVERKMLLDTFQKLMASGFSISDYQYTGLGSLYFVDFILFHRYLGITQMWSVEESTEIEKRVEFNKPFKCVHISIDDVANCIPQLSLDRKHILWLDYDRILNEERISAVRMAASHLPRESILIVTVDAEPPGHPEDGPRKWNPAAWREYFLDHAEHYLWPNPSPRDFARTKLASVNARILNNAIRNGLVGRTDVGFLPLFNFLYADGHQMVSVGGMIGGEVEERKLASLDRGALPFLRDDLTADPYEIHVPLVTRKERLYLDREMPCTDHWLPKDFELKPEEVVAYRMIYRYYPAYAEMLL